MFRKCVHKNATWKCGGEMYAVYDVRDTSALLRDGMEIVMEVHLWRHLEWIDILCYTMHIQEMYTIHGGAFSLYTSYTPV